MNNDIFYQVGARSYSRSKSIINRIKLKLMLAYLFKKTPGKFDLKKGYKIGRRFSVNRDLSETVIYIAERFQCRNDFTIMVGKNGHISLGENCFFNNRCSLNSYGKITIGNNCQFGENVLLYDHNHNFKDPTQLISEQGYDIGEIIIGNNCWISSGVIILKDVTIGDNVVIGAGCVIHKPIPSNTVVYNQQHLASKFLSGE